MALPLLALAAAAAVPQIAKGVSGLFQSARGKQMARQNIFPDEAVNQNLIQNSAEADAMAKEGMPSQQYNQQAQGILKNQAGGVRLLNRSSNPTSGVAGLVRAGDDATENLNVQDAIDRTNNEKFAIGQRGILAGEQNRVFDWNNRQKYLMAGQAAAQTISAGRQNTFGALDGLSSVAMSGLGGGQAPQGKVAAAYNPPNFGGTGFNMPTTQSLNPNYDPSQYTFGGRYPKTNFNFGGQ